jgi:hypothetical protein
LFHFFPVIFNPESFVIEVKISQGLTPRPVVDLIIRNTFFVQELNHFPDERSFQSRAVPASEDVFLPLTSSAGPNNDSKPHSTESLKRGPGPGLEHTDLGELMVYYGSVKIDTNGFLVGHQ